jgi:hypothetical protein
LSVLAQVEIRDYLLDFFTKIGILLVIIAITLVVVSETLSFYYGKVNIRINKKRLRRAAFASSTLFFIIITIIIAIRVLDIIPSGA